MAEQSDCGSRINYFTSITSTARFLEIKRQTSTLRVTLRIRFSECFSSTDLPATAAEWVAKASFIVHYKVTVFRKLQ